MQDSNPFTHNKSGYQGQIIAKRYFLMHSDLSTCKNDGWKQIRAFQNSIDYINIKFSENEALVEEYNERIRHIVRIMLQFLEKHFKKCERKLTF